MKILADILAHRLTERAILTLILINAVTLGLETSPEVMAVAGGLLHTIDRLILAIFVIEIAARIAVQRLAFFKDPWNIFDFLVVGIALVPASGPLSVLRALRVLRVLRLITFLPSLKRVVSALVGALPGMGSIILLLLLITYVGSVMATKLFGASFPEQYGSIAASAFTLFQLMTLDGWSGEIVRPVMREYPYAWLFFFPFILATAFTMLNLFIGVVVNAMQAEHEATRAAAEASTAKDDEERVLHEIRALRSEIAALKLANGQNG